MAWHGPGMLLLLSCMLLNCMHMRECLKLYRITALQLCLPTPPPLHPHSTPTPPNSTHRRNLRILAAGGDGTVAWLLKTIGDLGLEPQPAVAVLPLGTGNDLSLSFGWGNAFLEKWIAAPQVGGASGWGQWGQPG